MKDWTRQDWADWLLRGAMQAYHNELEMRRGAFDPAPMSSHRSPALSVVQYVRPLVVGDHAARDAGLVDALNHWNADRGGPALHVLLELTRRWKPLGASGAIVNLAEQGDLRDLPPAALDPVVRDGFHTLAKLNDAQAIRTFETALRKHDLWGRERHVLPALVSRTRTAKEEWRSHFIDLHRDFRRVKKSSDRAEAIRCVAGAVTLPTFISGIEGGFQEDIQQDIAALLREEHRRVLAFEVRFSRDRQNTRPERERVRIQSANYEHNWMDVPYKGLLRELLHASAEMDIPPEERF